MITVPRKSLLFKDVQSNSGVYHAIPRLIFLDNKISYQVGQIDNDANGYGLKIKNEQRLKRLLFNRILDKYNNRINTQLYGFNNLKKKMSQTDISNLEIIKYRFIRDREEIEDSSNLSFSGYYNVYPQTFVCNQCGHLKYFDYQNNPISNFRNKCERPGCSGHYEQSTLLLYCPTCGKVEPLNYKDRDNDVQLIRPNLIALGTWQVKSMDTNKEPIDLFRLTCDHYDGGQIVSEKPRAKREPITIKEGSAFLPVCENFLDLPAPEGIDFIDQDDLEYYLLGVYLESFKDLGFEVLEDITYNIKQFKDPVARRNERKRARWRNLSDEDFEKAWNEECFYNKILKIVDKLHTGFSEIALENINNYAALLGIFAGKDENPLKNSDKYTEYLPKLANQDKSDEFRNLQDTLSISEIHYIPNIRLIQTCYGLVYGFNRFNDNAFVPHFDPHWQSLAKKEKFYAYCHPFETEGLLFELSKIKIVDWLIANGLLDASNKCLNEKDASYALLKLEQKSKPFEAVFKLVHTLSHILISSSSIYTGISSDSCGELLFPSLGALFIYSTSPINIGGYKFIFKHEIENWIGKIKLDVKECTFDPECLHQGGACFSCMYVPEYTCNHFNSDLDRDVFLGKHRYKEGFWY